MAWTWTPPPIPQLGQVPPVQPAPQATPGASNFNWGSLIAPATLLGGQLFGNYLNNKQVPAATAQQIAEQKRQFDITNQMRQGEIARRDQIGQAIAPTLVKQLGFRDPAQVQQMASQMSRPTSATSLGNTSGTAIGGGTGSSVPYTQPSKAASTIGAVGGLASWGLGLLSLASKAAPFGPIGAAVGGAAALGSLAANKIGQGRRTANSFVQQVEDPFGQQDLPKVVDLMKAGQMDQAKALFNEAYGKYKQAVAQWQATGGNQEKVASQSTTNPKLQTVIQTIAQQLGVPI